MNDKQPENKLGGMPFGEAVERLAKTNPNEMPSKDIVPHKHNGQIVHQRATDGYINATAMCKASNKEWSNYNQNSGTQSFLDALERSLGIPRDLLIQTITGGPNDRRGTWVHPQVAINLATWLSPDFAVQVSEWVVTWMMGIAKRKSLYPDFASLNEDEKRLYLRDQVAASNKKLAEAAQGSGVVTPQDFSIFQAYGYRGMYDGRAVNEIRAVKGLPKSAQILDHMGSAELAANLFRITQTEEKLINEKISNKFAANHAHFQVGQRVRAAMIDISGMPPEKLPVAPDVKKLQKQLSREIQNPITELAGEHPGQTISGSALEKQESVFSDKPINLNEDLWKYALLVMATKPDGIVSTSYLIGELPNYIHVPDDSQEVLTGRKDSKFSQLVRNLKSHKTSKTNFIYLGLAEDIPNGFRITGKGREFVLNYFKEEI